MKRKMSKKNEYASKFLKSSATVADERIQVCISDEKYQQLMQILQTCGDGQIDLNGYLDNILSDHLDRLERSDAGLSVNTSL